MSANEPICGYANSKMIDESPRKIWDETWVSKHRVTPYECKWYTFLSRFIPKKRVLEAGCGSGRGLAVFSKSYAIGLDSSLNAIRLSQNNLRSHKNYDLILGDVRYLPFKDASFDLVFNSGVIEHLKPREDAVAAKEMLRVTEPKGTVVASVPNLLCLWYMLGKYLSKLFGQWKYGFERAYTPSKLKCLFHEAGLTTIQFCGILLFPLPLLDNLGEKFKFLESFCYAIVIVGRKIES